MNAVWLSPIFASRASHGYDVNYYRIADAVAVPGDLQGTGSVCFPLWNLPPLSTSIASLAR